MKKLTSLIVATIISMSMMGQIVPYSINSGGNLNSSVGILLSENDNGNINGFITIVEETSTNIEGVLNNKNINVYPNPTMDYININCDENVNYQLINIDGKLILEGTDRQINVLHVKKGNYLLKINEQTFKIIKQ